MIKRKYPELFQTDSVLGYIVHSINRLGLVNEVVGSYRGIGRRALAAILASLYVSSYLCGVIGTTLSNKINAGLAIARSGG
jgi:hypothetical protein